MSLPITFNGGKYLFRVKIRVTELINALRSADSRAVADLEYQKTKKILAASMERNSVWLRMDGSSDNSGDQRHAAVVRPRSSSRTETKVQRPHRYKVLLLNDDFTPMDFVIDVLQKFFNMSHKQASEVMLQVHHEGMGLCGVFSFEVAETKAVQVLESARKQQHPLQCRLQRE